MITIAKYVIGIAIAFAILFGLYVNKPKIEVTAEATANATSTVIVPRQPTSTIEISRETTTTSKGDTVYIHNTYVETIEKPAPVVEQVVAGSMEPIVAPPVFTDTATLPAPIIVNPTPITITPIIVQPAPIQPQPVEHEPIEPEIVEELSFIESPRMWDEMRNDGKRLFFEATWEGNAYGSIQCDGIYYAKQSVRSGFYFTIQHSALEERFGKGQNINCVFSVEGIGESNFIVGT